MASVTRTRPRQAIVSPAPARVRRAPSSRRLVDRGGPLPRRVRDRHPERGAEPGRLHDQAGRRKGPRERHEPHEGPGPVGRPGGGGHLDPLDDLGEHLNAPVITGQTPVKQREELFQSFREGTTRVLVVSKVANFSIDLPEASVAIQISGSYGPRQEEAQRLGRVLRPKANGAKAHFYTLITRDTKEQEFGMNRQLFLIEQGYSYEVREWRDYVVNG